MTKWLLVVMIMPQSSVTVGNPPMIVFSGFPSRNIIVSALVDTEDECNALGKSYVKEFNDRFYACIKFNR